MLMCRRDNIKSKLTGVRRQDKNRTHCHSCRPDVTFIALGNLESRQGGGGLWLTSSRVDELITLRQVNSGLQYNASSQSLHTPFFFPMKKYSLLFVTTGYY
jgi:hypothetical protein